MVHILSHLFYVLLLLLVLTKECKTEHEKDGLVIFIFIHKRMFGSDIMRGLMMADALQKHEKVKLCKATNIAADIKSLQKIDACIFLKFLIGQKEVIAACKARGATVFMDVIDHAPLLAHLASFVEHKGQPERDWKSMVWLVQSQYFAKKLNEIGLTSYTYPHHHSNFYNWSVAETEPRELAPNEPLDVRFLAGNAHNNPDFDQVLIPAVCAGGGVFSAIDQRLGGVKFRTKSSVYSKRTIFSCPSNASHQPELTHKTETDFADDHFGQAAFYLDANLVGTDVAIVWPSRSFNSSAYSKDSLNRQMLRPPTRMIHWMSRGVPVVYFPTHAYQDVAASGSYNIPGSASSLCVQNASAITRVLKELRSREVRRSLREQGLAIAKKYSLESIADVFVQLALACPKSTCISSNQQSHRGQSQSQESGLGYLFFGFLILLLCGLQYNWPHQIL